MHSFNLVDQPWVPVRTLDGGLVTLSLRDTLLQAHRLRRLEDASPLVLAALHRFLLAVMHRACEGPGTTEQAARWFQEGFPEDRITAYLDRQRERLDLFHPTRPFFQVPGLEQVAKPQPWTILLPQEGSNNSNLLFNPSKRAGYSPNPARPDEAVRALLTCQTCALGGFVMGKVFRDSMKASPIASAALVIVLGENLHETLCLNLVPYTVPSGNSPTDVPIWERDDVLTVEYMRKKPQERAIGHVQGYTWPNRSVLLLPEGRDGQAAVVTVLLAEGMDLQESEAYRTDPMVAYRTDDKTGLRPYGFSPWKGFWRDFAALLPRRAPGGGVEPRVVSHAGELYRALRQRQRPLKTMVAGLSSNKAKIQLWRVEVFDLPPAVLSDRGIYEMVKAALNEAEEGGRLLYGASLTLAEGLLSRGERNPSVDDKRNLVKSLPGNASYWSGLETYFATFLSSLTPAPDDEAMQTRVMTDWREALYRTLQRGWEQNTRAAGNDARALRAVAQADRVLRPRLAELYRKAYRA